MFIKRSKLVTLILLNNRSVQVVTFEINFEKNYQSLCFVHLRHSYCIMHQSIPAAPSVPPPPPGLLQGICPPCQSLGWDICKFCTARGPGICQSRGDSRAFDTHAVSYHNITTHKVLLEKKQIGSTVKDRKE